MTDKLTYKPPNLEYSDPPKNPLIGLVAAYTKIDVLRIDPRLKVNNKSYQRSI